MEISISLVGLEPTIARLHTEFHYSSCLRSSKQGISNIFLYFRVFKQRNCIRKWQKNLNWICPMTAILNGTICGKTVSFTAWHTPEMDSARNLYIEPINEILFLKNAYRSLFRAIFQYFVLTIPRVPDPTSKWKMVSDYSFYSVRKQSTTMPYIPISELAHTISKQLLFVCVQRGALLSRPGCYCCACYLNRVARVMLS